jgi:hypothetical protein
VRRSKALATVLERATITDASGRTVDLEHLRLPRLEDSEDEAGSEDSDSAEAPASAPEAGSATSIRPIGS